MSDRETKNLEFKQDLTNTFLKTVSAYANYTDGVIIFGKNDEGQVLGMEYPVKSCIKIEEKINNSIKPLPEYELNIEEKSGTITLKVYKGINTPYLYSNKAYKRSDSSTVEVDRVEINRLILEGQNRNFEELPSVKKDFSFHYLEKKLVDAINIEKLNADILKTLNLLSDKDGYNKAAEMLSDHNDFPGIDVVKFGDGINELLEREILEKTSVVELYDSAVKIFERNYSMEIIAGGARKTKEAIPKAAFREALANAIVHRTWDIQAPIKVSMYKDYIEIASPGGLPYGISKDEYLNGQISVLRNPILSNVFFKLKYIEKFGTGVRRIKQTYEQSVVKPKFEVFENSITIELPRMEETTNQFNEDSKNVFAVLKKERAIPRDEIERLTGYNKDKVIRLLNTLIDSNAVEKIGAGRGTRYRRL
jgi:ATP-dependent DNA helicase RecG